MKPLLAGPALLASVFLSSTLVLGDGPGLLAPGAKVEKLSGSFEFTEGPAADKAGNVYFTDQPNDRIVRWDARTGAFSDWLKPAGRSNGTYFDKAGNLLACADEKNELWSISASKEVTVLATAHSTASNRGTNEEEPMLMTIRYGKGRVFHTTLGHDVPAMECVGFIATLQRGTEWAATGKVTQKVPADFPGADQPRLRK